MKKMYLIGVVTCSALMAAAPVKADPNHLATHRGITRDFLKTVCATMERIKMQVGDPVIVLCMAPPIDDHESEIHRIRCGGPVAKHDDPDSRYILVIDPKCRMGGL